MGAILGKTGARRLFGVSSGAIITLQAGLTLAGVEKVAAYEPTFSVPGYDSDDFVHRYEEEIAQGRTAEANVTVLKGLEMGPRVLRILPRRIATFLVQRLIEDEDKKATDNEVTFGSLVPTLHYDFRVSDEGSRQLNRFRAMPSEVLLLGGGKSPTYLKAALDALERTLPSIERVEFPGLNHVASGNTDQGGKPELVARELRSFFA